MNPSVFVQPSGNLNGNISAVSSKSHAHRVIIAACGALISGTCDDFTIYMNRIPGDIFATLGCVRQLGISATVSEDTIVLRRNRRGKDDGLLPVLDCFESGSTLRFILPFALNFCNDFVLTGEGNLPYRPMESYEEVFKQKGVSFEHREDIFLPVHVRGKLSAGRYILPGNISSQYFSGLLMALPMCEGKSELFIEGSVESKPYIDLTLDVLKFFGINWDVSDDSRHYVITGPVAPVPAENEVYIEGDWSCASYWLLSNELGGSIKVSGLLDNSLQGDRLFHEIIRKCTNGYADVSNNPDLVPVLAVYIMRGNKDVTLTGTKRLKLKESNRIDSVCRMVSSLGGCAIPGDDSILIRGIGEITGGTVDSCFDHRISMAAAIAGAYSKNGVTLINPFVTDKSYPGFFRDFSLLGGKWNVGNFR